MTKLISHFFIILLFATLAACGGGGEDGTDTGTGTNNTVDTPSGDNTSTTDNSLAVVNSAGEDITVNVAKLNTGHKSACYAAPATFQQRTLKVVDGVAELTTYNYDDANCAGQVTAITFMKGTLKAQATMTANWWDGSVLDTLAPDELPPEVSFTPLELTITDTTTGLTVGSTLFLGYIIDNKVDGSVRIYNVTIIPGVDPTTGEVVTKFYGNTNDPFIEEI